MKAGFARVDITPPLGTFISGYYQDRFAKAVLDPLQINMLAFATGESKALVAQIDTMALSDMVADKMLAAITAATGIDRSAIILHASHTHDGGQLAMTTLDEEESKKSALGKCFATDRLYLAHTITRAVDAAKNALEDLKEAKLSIGFSKAERISFGRRYLMKDGSVKTNPGTNNPEIVKPVGTADDTVQVLRIDRENAKPIAVINFQTHPDVVGGETITADWPGLTRTVFEAATLQGCHCLVLNGTQGDVNHCNVLPRPGELNGLKRDFDDVDRGYVHAQHMANVLAASALNVWLKCEPVKSDTLKFAVKTVRVPAQKAKESDEKNLAWATKSWQLHEAGRDEEVSKEYGWTGMELTTEVARAGRIVKMSEHDDYHEVPLYGVAVGEVAFGGFPGEPFNEIGIAIRKASPFKLTMLSCITNGYIGYFPNAESFVQGGYESATSPFGPTVADDLIGGMSSLFSELK